MNRTGRAILTALSALALIWILALVLWSLTRASDYPYSLTGPRILHVGQTYMFCAPGDAQRVYWEHGDSTDVDGTGRCARVQADWQGPAHINAVTFDRNGLYLGVASWHGRVER